MKSKILLVVFYQLALMKQSSSAPPVISDLEGNDSEKDDCSWRHQLTAQQLEETDSQHLLENCIYYYLIEQHMKQGNTFDSFTRSPASTADHPTKLTFEQVLITRAEMKNGPSNFQLSGDMWISWTDNRLQWNATEWNVKSFILHDHHHIWTPTFRDESGCSSVESGCLSIDLDLSLSSDGKVSSTYYFRYPALCSMDFINYPEETNDCCVYLSTFETENVITYEVTAKGQEKMDKTVAIPSDDTNNFKSLMRYEASVWKIQERVLGISRISGLRSDYLRICIRAKKSMSTLRMALRIPATIATLLMLASPLFGDLRTQAFAKMVTLFLQTICFLFLCSIAPETGFGGITPRIYSFYEFLFIISAISITTTLICLALCRAKRTIPPTHNVYLTAKLVNRFLCCVEPEQSAGYERYFDESQENGGATEQQSSQTAQAIDHTSEWRHIYIAANNLISGICFSMFCLIVFIDSM